MKDPLDHWEFREILSFGLLHCNPRNRICPGDEWFRIARKQNRRKSKIAINFARDHAMANGANVSLQQMNHAVVGKINVPTRLCSSLKNIKKHHDAEVKSEHPHMCVVCG